MSFKEVNNLRKSGRLKEAFIMAKSDLKNDPSDWSLRALFWVLYDLCKLHIKNSRIGDANKVFNELVFLHRHMQDSDDVIEQCINTLQKQITPNWDSVNQLSELSKSGSVVEAYNRLLEIHESTPLAPLLHENFGWVIYRYLNSGFESIDVQKVEKALSVYLELNNERPSNLHSNMLLMALKACEFYKGIDFLSFLRKWDVSLFSEKDFRPSIWDGRNIAPLVERIIQRCFKLGYKLDEIVDAFSKCNRPICIMDVYSRFSFSEIAQNYNSDIQLLLTKFNEYFENVKSKDIKNDYHSKILSMYLNKQPEEQNEEMVTAIEKWGLYNFRDEDWNRDNKDGKEFPSLVEKTIGRILKALKLQQYSNVKESFLDLLQKAISFYHDDNLERHLAQIKLSMGKKDEGVAIYRKLLLKSNRFYLWKELADAIDDKKLKISALCKAILSEPKDEFLGDVRLSLAQLLIDENKFDLAKCELNTFKKTYQRLGWNLKNEYVRLSQIIPESVAYPKDNNSYYQENQAVADDFIFSDIDWVSMVVCDIYSQKINNKEIEKAKLVSSEGVEVSVKVKTLHKNKRELIGCCYDVKLINRENNKTGVGLIRTSDKNAVDVLKSVVCYVDYFNKEKKLYHVVSQNNERMILVSDMQLEIGQYCLCCAIPQKSDIVGKPLRALFIRIENPDSAVLSFPQKVAVVDHVNNSKQLFHCVFGHRNDIIIKYSETELRPNIADVVNIHYYSKKLKDGRIIRRMLQIESLPDCETKLKKTAEGVIRIKYNAKGNCFGFVGDYYVPENLLDDVFDGDKVQLSMVYNGEKWVVYQLMRIQNNKNLI